VIYTKVLHDEMVRDKLTRKQLAERHAVSSDRITQWLRLVKLLEKKKREIEALSDYWDRKVVTERWLRNLRRRR
jgi:ABC-type branched-subunit amino acid transport system ATPase component